MRWPSSVCLKCLHYEVLASLSVSLDTVCAKNGPLSPSPSSAARHSQLLWSPSSLTFVLPSQFPSPDLSGHPRLHIREEGEPGTGSESVTMVTPLHRALSLSVVMELIGDGDADSCYAPAVSVSYPQLQRVRDQISEQGFLQLPFLRLVAINFSYDKVNIRWTPCIVHVSTEARPRAPPRSVFTSCRCVCAAAPS